jgi:hypothetical protein
MTKSANYRNPYRTPYRIYLRVGAVFNRLRVDGPPVSEGGVLFYPCRCECGNSLRVRSQDLREGNTRSCGCLQRERASEANTRHGKSHTSIHNIWMCMLARCENPKAEFYADYGGRGIKVCERWHLFENFYADVGEPPPGLTLERRDNNGDYEPGNCTWATRQQQANNRRSNKPIEFAGKVMNQIQWERELGLREGQIYDRLRRGWSVERALTTGRHSY